MKMANGSLIEFFILAAYGELGHTQYVYFLFILLLYLFIVMLNILLISTISLDRQLHKPMYFFMVNLGVNGLYGSLGLIPTLLVHVLSGTHEISRPACLVQIFCLHTYGVCEFTTLAVMAYDRYVSICNPLWYDRIMTPLKVFAFVAGVWLFTVGKTSVTVVLTSQLPLCGMHIEKLYCDNFSLVKLACRDTTVNNVYGLVSLFMSVGPQLSLILYSYGKIITISLKASSNSRAKAVHTCTPHLISLANFSIACTFEVLQSRFDMSKVPRTFRLIVSVYFLVFTPLLNPIIYGVRSEVIRKSMLKVLNIKRTTNQAMSNQTQ
ncbi:olfactory receptor 1M1-like [Anguilla anguilla]|uniref:olfactory receptor 1M1-like n=1 Tax=Anguilla anguilla TaxID=7936 RepID=UPI0015AA4E3A|nr:olfactory receptor 1M1-like [Anguilla anguilla]XP_035242015.1 olfactory receptor 1M1-like [Anguilla anguilla]